MITDGHPVHKSKKLLKYLETVSDRLKVFTLPPDLNPDELVWNYLRQIGTARMSLKKMIGTLLFAAPFLIKTKIKKGSILIILPITLLKKNQLFHF